MHRACARAVRNRSRSRGAFASRVIQVARLVSVTRSSRASSTAARLTPRSHHTPPFSRSVPSLASFLLALRGWILQPVCGWLVQIGARGRLILRDRPRDGGPLQLPTLGLTMTPALSSKYSTRPSFLRKGLRCAPHDRAGNTFSEVGLALDGARRPSRPCWRREAVQARAPALDADHVQVLRAGVVRAVHHRAHGHAMDILYLVPE